MTAPLPQHLVLGQRECPGCKTLIDRARDACPACWDAVPEDLRAAVAEARSRYRRAHGRLIKHLRDHREATS